MGIATFSFGHVQHPHRKSATHLLIRLVMRPPFSIVVAGAGLPPTRKGQAVEAKPLKRQLSSPRFALKDSDPLRAEARVESYAAVARPDAPSGASNRGF